MFFFKTKIFILFMVIAAGATFYYFGDSEKLLNKTIEALEKTPLKSVTQQIKSSRKEDAPLDINGTVQNAQVEFSNLSSRIQEVKKHTDNIFGTTDILQSSIQATKDATPIHEKVFEYGKYVYCKSVIEDYENKNDSL